MKYANIERLGYRDGKNRIGVGDYVQLLAIDNLYREMGVAEEVVYLDLWDINTYRGEKLVLPINQLIGGKPWLDEYGNFLISENIVPIFLGISLRKGFFNFSEFNIAFLKKYAPIGCRDYYTLQQMQKYSVPAYMAGCLTITLPKREMTHKKYDRIFLVDVPVGLKKYIPDNILNCSEIVHHTFETDEQKFNDIHFGREVTKNLFKMYEEEAELVITSRLHCAAPCLAMGIPVIIAKQYRGYTFDWIQNFARVYTEEEYADISWNYEPLLAEEYKQMAKRVAIERIRGRCIKEDIERINSFYLLNYTSDYKAEEMSITHFVNELEKRFDKKDSFNYAIWGISVVAENIYEYLSKNYPNAKMVKVIDSFSQKTFHGFTSEKPDVLKKNDPFVTIVATINCMDSGAKPLFASLGKDESQYIYAADSFL